MTTITSFCVSCVDDYVAIKSNFCDTGHWAEWKLAELVPVITQHNVKELLSKLTNNDKPIVKAQYLCNTVIIWPDPISPYLWVCLIRMALVVPFLMFIHTVTEKFYQYHDNYFFTKTRNIKLRCQFWCFEAGLLRTSHEVLWTTTLFLAKENQMTIHPFLAMIALNWWPLEKNIYR